jgi:hypothetical protein
MGGTRPPSPATCVREAVTGFTAGFWAGGLHACATAIRTSQQRGHEIRPIQGGSGPVIPQKAYDIYNYVMSHNFAAKKYYPGNTVFENNKQQLPPGDYREYDLDPRPPTGTPRGLERIVVEIPSGKAWYSPNHSGDKSDGNPPFIPMN